ncbi:Sialic acid O-acyltransferase, NeuD [Candidatus Magnetoovum chiemensis]|nr:Sialic acid O-acyltransferase, NeuD [Candidatus Magnetoovum chiemensis]
MKDKIVLLGGGGHAKVLIELIKALDRYNISCILDPVIEPSTEVMGIEVLGGDQYLEGLFTEGVINACISLGSVKADSRRKGLYEKVRNMGFLVPSLIHPKAIVSTDAIISEGVQIMAGAILQTGSIIGENSVINTGAIIEHDCRIGNHVHVCPGAVVCGGCCVGDGAFVGAAATVIQCVNIGNNATVAAGASVIGNVPDGCTVKGIPAQ